MRTVVTTRHGWCERRIASIKPTDEVGVLVAFGKLVCANTPAPDWEQLQAGMALADVPSQLNGVEWTGHAKAAKLKRVMLKDSPRWDPTTDSAEERGKFSTHSL